MEKVYIVVVTDRGDTTSVVACGNLSTAIKKNKKAKTAIIEKYKGMGFDFNDGNDVKEYADDEFQFGIILLPNEDAWSVDVKIHTKDIIM